MKGSFETALPNKHIYSTLHYRLLSLPDFWLLNIISA